MASVDKQYITPETKAKLEEELNALIAHRPAVAAEINERREEGDLKENAGYDAAREMQDQEEARMIGTARNDVRYALTMVDRADITRDDLRKLVRDLADHVVCVARVADMREERLKDPSYGPAVRAIEGALRKALPTRSAIHHERS